MGGKIDMRVAGYGLRDLSFGLRGAGKKGIEHIEEFGSRNAEKKNAEVGKRQSPWSQVTSL